MSSSSSEDEYDETLLKEAIATDFISDEIYRGGCGCRERNGVARATNPASLRAAHWKEENQFNALPVTVEFQQHVAKQLAALLDGSLKEKCETRPTKMDENQTKSKGGVRLFSNSSRYLKCSKRRANATANRNKKQPSADSDSEEAKKRLRSAVVDSQCILRKKELEHWSQRSKAPVFRYVPDKDGQLRLLE